MCSNQDNVKEHAYCELQKTTSSELYLRYFAVQQLVQQRQRELAKKMIQDEQKRDILSTQRTKKNIYEQ